MRRSEIREHIFKLVFCGDFHSAEEIPEQIRIYFEELPDVTETDQNYMADKVERIRERIPEIDGRINGVAQGWKTQRMGKTELAVLRLAVYEMKYDEEIPVGVAINEAVELAKKFGSDESPSFVNGILAKLV